MREFFSIIVSNWDNSFVLIGSVITFSTIVVYSCIDSARSSPHLEVINSLSADYRLGAISNELVKLKDTVENSNKQISFTLGLQNASLEDIQRIVEDHNERISKIEECLTDSD